MKIGKNMKVYDNDMVVKTNFVSKTQRMISV